jgi:hypothetical protein
LQIENLIDDRIVAENRSKTRDNWLAEGERFELSDLLQSPVFKTGAFNRSANSPLQYGFCTTILALAAGTPGN